MDEAPARAARIDAPLLNARLSKAQDADELLGLFARHGWQMDGMHTLTLALPRCARMR